MEELRCNSLMKYLQANSSQPLTRDCVDVRERLMRIRIIEKMKEPELKAYGSRLGIRDVSYARSGGMPVSVLERRIEPAGAPLYGE